MNAMKKIDLNSDMGESFGTYTIGMDSEVIRYVTSANIACGFHAGDPHVMDATIKLAKGRGVGVGAHPGYPDLIGFGRRNMDCAPNEIRDYLIYQIGAMQAFCRVHDVKLQHVKPHGSLYNMSVGNEAMSRTIAEAIASVDPTLLYVTLAGSHSPLMTRIARDTGIRVAFEAFPDRAYTAEGVLASRRLPGAVIKDPKVATERALRMAKERKVIATDGTILEMEIHTLCVHGDNPAAVELVKQIRTSLERERLDVVPMGTFI